MSQKKVDAYKAEKANREKIMKKEKRVIPKGAIAVCAWGSRPFVPEINRSAWGTVDYSRQLTPEEIRDYELMPANVVQQPIEMEG